MPEVLSGSQPGLTPLLAYTEMGSLLGEDPEDSVFRTMVDCWIRAIVQDIQLRYPQLRRTTVHDADFTVVPGQAEYDVRASVADGGFGWDNCWQIWMLTIPEVASRPLEPLHLLQWRDRSYLPGDQGPSYGWVWLDQFRIRLIPAPDQAYVGKGDYFQDIPVPNGNSSQTIDWPRAWDACFREGLEYRAFKWQHQQQPSIWMPQYRIYQTALGRLWNMDQSNPVMPRQAIHTRTLRHRRHIIRDRSTDTRHRW